MYTFEQWKRFLKKHTKSCNIYKCFHSSYLDENGNYIISDDLSSHEERARKTPKMNQSKTNAGQTITAATGHTGLPGRPDGANGPEYAAPGLWFRGHWDWAVLMLEWEGPMPCFLGGGYALQTMMSIFFKICPTLNYLYFNMGGQQCHVKSWLSKWKTQVQWTSFRCSKLCMNCSVW